MNNSVENIYIMVGLPGSGKTTFARTFLSDSADFIDDLSVIFKEKNKDWNEVLKTDKNTLVITDVLACFENSQKFLFDKLTEYFPQSKQHWFFFSNDKALCEKNVKARDDGRNVQPTLDYYARIYKVSEFIIQHAHSLEYMPVYQSPRVKP